MAERARADEERTRADEERTRADDERTRADDERTRADEAAARIAAMLLDVLHLRGIPISDEQAQRIRSTTDLALLERWSARAFTAANIDVLFADD